MPDASSAASVDVRPSAPKSIAWLLASDTTSKPTSRTRRDWLLAAEIHRGAGFDWPLEPRSALSRFTSRLVKPIDAVRTRSSASDDTPSSETNDVSPVSAMVSGPAAGTSADGTGRPRSELQAMRRQQLRIKK